MKLNLAIPGLLIALLVGCNDTTTTVAPTVSPNATANPTSNPVVSEKKDTPTPTPTSTNPPNSFAGPTTTPVVSEKTPTPTPTPTNSPNPFDSDSFPKAGCGDRMPTDKKTDTIKLYPVFVDYSDSNLQTIKANYCGDALKKIIKNKGKYVIQVASFIDEKRVNQFKEFLARKLGNTSVEVGEATVIGANPIPIVLATKPKPQPTKDAVAKAAQLKPDQVEQLKNIIFKDTLGKLHKVEAIVPTYVPPGFKLDKFEVKNQAEDIQVGYTLVYRNASNSCFRINAYQHGPGAGPPLVVKTIKGVNSPALGEVMIGYTEFDKTYNSAKIEAILTHSTEVNGTYAQGTSRWVYSFYSPDYANLRENNYVSVPICNTISLVEAVKIFESLSYLYPDNSRNLSFDNGITDQEL
jgi:hypothetical protein